MKAAFIEQPGPPEAIRYAELATPTPKSGEVLVRVGAVSVNPIDTYVRSGTVKMNPPMPFVVGCDLAGVVEKCGPDCRIFKTGDRVWGSNQGLLGRQGTFAEYAAVREEWLYPTPERVDDETVAAAALVGITAWLGLVVHARLQAGETVFVNGGTGGVGSMVVQMAKAMQARAITTAGTDEKVNISRQLGADVAINYKTQDVDAAIRAAAPEGVNVWWESLREPNFERSIPMLARGGRFIIMAGREARPIFPVGPFYTRDCSMHGFAMFNAKPDVQRLAAADINRWLAEGAIKPRIDRVMKLSEAAEAHRLQEDNSIRSAGTLSGKIVLKP